MSGKSQRANSEKPWYRKVKDAWYCWKDGKQVPLGVKGKENKKQAQEAFYRPMRAKDEPPKHNPEQKPDRRKRSRSLEIQEVKPHDASSSLGGDMLTNDEIAALAKQVAEQIKKPEAKTTTTTLQQLVDGFLKDKQDEICVEAWRGYRKFLHPLAKKFGTRQAETLTAEEAEDFVKKPEWSSTYRAGCLGTIVSLYRWGVRKKLHTSSPVEGVKKPPKVSRGTKAVISEDEHKKLLEVADENLLFWCEDGVWHGSGPLLSDQPATLVECDPINIQFSGALFGSSMPVVVYGDNCSTMSVSGTASVPLPVHVEANHGCEWKGWIGESMGHLLGKPQRPSLRDRTAGGGNGRTRYLLT